MNIVSGQSNDNVWFDLQRRVPAGEMVHADVHVRVRVWNVTKGTGHACQALCEPGVYYIAELEVIPVHGGLVVGCLVYMCVCGEVGFRILDCNTEASSHV